MIQTTFDTKDFNTADTATGTAGNTTSCQGLIDVAGGVGQISSNKLKLNGTNFQTADVRHATTVKDGGLRSKITQTGSVSTILKCRSLANNAGCWAWLNGHIVMTVATSGGTPGSFPTGSKAIGDGTYTMELSAQTIDASHSVLTTKVFDATTSAVIDMYALVDGTAALQVTASLGISGGLANPSFADDAVFFTLPSVLTDTLNVVFEGDSLTSSAGSTAGHEYPTVTGTFLGSNATVTNYGHSGDTVANIVTDYPTSVKTAYVSTAGVRNILVLRIGTNDAFFSRTSTQIYSDIKAYCQQALADNPGYIIFVWVIIERTDGTLPGTWLATVQAVNSNLRSNAVSEGWCHAIIDVDARFLPGSGESNNTTWYSADKIHHNDAGYMQDAIVASEAIRDYILQHPAATYSLKPSAFILN